MEAAEKTAAAFQVEATEEAKDATETEMAVEAAEARAEAGRDGN